MRPAHPSSKAKAWQQMQHRQNPHKHRHRNPAKIPAGRILQHMKRTPSMPKGTSAEGPPTTQATGNTHRRNYSRVLHVWTYLVPDRRGRGGWGRPCCARWCAVHGTQRRQAFPSRANLPKEGPNPRCPPPHLGGPQSSSLSTAYQQTM